ncbi:MAG: serine/threonine-protein kinase [Myxococcales bacterium]
MPLSASPQPSSTAEGDPLIGRTVNDRYRIVEAIGQGGMGRVYKALQTPLDRVVALKILGAGHERDPNFYKRFFLEASVTAKLTHPNTITLYDYGRTDDGIFFIAMEFLDGRTLSQAMQQEGPLAQERVIHVAQQICRSVREAHALGIIHRDLKPANVMLLRQHDDHDFVKVLDFGLVKFFQGDNPDGEITNAGTFMGSPHYIAPEQARNQGPDQRCDLYSLGILLYQMLTGKVPFTAPNPVDIILKHLHEAPVPPRELRPDLVIDAQLEAIVLRCMAKDRADRFQSMDELLVALKLLRQQLTGTPGAPHPAAPPITPDSVHPVAPRIPSAPVPSPPAAAMTPVSSSRAARPPPLPPDALRERARWHRFTGMGDPPSSVQSIWFATGAAVLAAAALAVWMGSARRQRPRPMVTVEHGAPVVVAPPAPPPHPAYQPASAGVTLVTLTSAPSGAEVNDADGRALGRTPMDLPVSAGRPLQLVLKLDGYKAFPVVRRSLSGDRIAIAATLKKEPSKVEPQPPPVRRAVGYKDDPY